MNSYTDATQRDTRPSLTEGYTSRASGLADLPAVHSAELSVGRFVDATTSDQSLLGSRSRPLIVWQQRLALASEPKYHLLDQSAVGELGAFLVLHNLRSHTPPAMSRSVRASLTDRERAALERVLPVILKVARQDAIPVRHVAIERFNDPEEGSSEIVIIQWVDASPEAAFALWDQQGTAVEMLYDILPPVLADIARERISVEVRWVDGQPQPSQGNDDEPGV
jgi:hypothetical protein